MAYRAIDRERIFLESPIVRGSAPGCGKVDEVGAEAVRLLDRDHVARFEDVDLASVPDLADDHLLRREWTVSVFVSPKQERRAVRGQLGGERRLAERLENAPSNRPGPIERLTKLRSSVTERIVEEIARGAWLPSPMATERAGSNL